MNNRPTLTRLSRRSLLAIGGLTTAGAAATAFSSAPAFAAPTAPAVGGHRRLSDAIAELERATSVTIGVTAIWHDSRRSFRYRGDQRFPMCSLFKTLAAAALVQARGYDEDYWTTPIPFTRADIVENSRVLEKTTTYRATPEELADAALRFSDNTAGNLILRELGGPSAITSFAAALGATATRLDRWEPELNDAVPGDERDTSTPDDIAAVYRALILEQRAGVLAAARLREWMLRNTTSGARMRAGLSAPFELADKTGGGDYGVVNDAGVLWRPTSEPLVLAIMTRTDRADAPYNNEVLAQVTRLIAAA
jgi:beta-lactamase class A